MDDEKQETSGDEERSGTVVNIAFLDTYTLMRVFIGLLANQAWQDVGLVMNPQTQKTEKNIERAKIAIDCIAFLIEKLEPQLQNEEKEKLRSLLTDLQLNFVQQQ
ncbi:MAG: DUF1844 domain-containing protein [Candidatus Hodarchaeota archaeon]